MSSQSKKRKLVLSEPFPTQVQVSTRMWRRLEMEDEQGKRGYLPTNQQLIFIVLDQVTQQALPNAKYKMVLDYFNARKYFGVFGIEFNAPYPRPVILRVKNRYPERNDAVRSCQSNPFLVVTHANTFKLEVVEEPKDRFEKYQGDRKTNCSTVLVKIEPKADLCDVKLQFELLYANHFSVFRDEPFEILRCEKRKGVPFGHARIDFRINTLSVNHDDQQFRLRIGALERGDIQSCVTKAIYVASRVSNKRSRSAMNDDVSNQPNKRMRLSSPDQLTHLERPCIVLDDDSDHEDDTKDGEKGPVLFRQQNEVAIGRQKQVVESSLIPENAEDEDDDDLEILSVSVPKQINPAPRPLVAAPSVGAPFPLGGTPFPRGVPNIPTFVRPSMGTLNYHPPHALINADHRVGRFPPVEKPRRSHPTPNESDLPRSKPPAPTPPSVPSTVPPRQMLADPVPRQAPRFLTNVNAHETAPPAPAWAPRGERIIRMQTNAIAQIPTVVQPSLLGSQVSPPQPPPPMNPKPVPVESLPPLQVPSTLVPPGQVPPLPNCKPKPKEIIDIASENESVNDSDTEPQTNHVDVIQPSVQPSPLKPKKSVEQDLDLHDLMLDFPHGGDLFAELTAPSVSEKKEEPAKEQVEKKSEEKSEKKRRSPPRIDSKSTSRIDIHDRRPYFIDNVAICRGMKIDSDDDDDDDGHDSDTCYGRPPRILARFHDTSIFQDLDYIKEAASMFIPKSWNIQTPLHVLCGKWPDEMEYSDVDIEIDSDYDDLDKFLASRKR